MYIKFVKIFDAHLHLKDNRNFDKGICCSVKEDDWEEISKISEISNNIIPAFGIHPWQVGAISESWDVRLKKRLLSKKSLIGETGLDYLRGNKTLQIQIFRRHLEIAQELNIPIIIHCVKAWGELVGILSKYKIPAFIAHGYCGSPDITKKLSDMNGYFSFGVRLLDEKEKKMKLALSAAPKNRILLEGENGNILNVINAASSILKISPAEVAEMTYSAGEQLLTF